MLASQWTVALQAPLSVGFPGQEYWSGVSFPSQPTDQIQISCIAGRFFTIWATREVLDFIFKFSVSLEIYKNILKF